MSDADFETVLTEIESSDSILALARIKARLALLENVAEAARECVTLEYDPARSQEINEELGRRADVLREALRALDGESGATHEHEWEHPYPTLDSNPPQYARRCKRCGFVQRKHYGDWEDAGFDEEGGAG